MKKFAGIILLFLLCKVLYAQEPDNRIKDANDLYKQQQYDKAIAAYQEVLKTDPANATAKFNSAITLYRQSKNEEAIKFLEDVIMNASEAELKGKAYYNKGVILTNQQKLEESIEAYKNALRQNPGDNEARENLQKALRELKKKTPPPPPPPPKEDKKKKQQQQPKMNKKEAEQRLKLLEQKEKEVQERIQKEKSKTGGNQQKDW